MPRVFLLPTLIVSSYIFYGWGAGFFVLLLACTSSMDYLLALYFSDKYDKRRYGIIISAIIVAIKELRDEYLKKQYARLERIREGTEESHSFVRFE